MDRFEVTRSSQVLVTPAEPTPAVTLPLSALEKYGMVRNPIIMLHVYSQGGETAARVIERALAKVLVLYYPLAGRLVDDPAGGGFTQVDCTGEGVWFTEARADCTLEDVRHLDHPRAMPLDLLLPPRWEDHTTLQMLVTQFSCGGFTVGVRMNHAIVDGKGFGQFFNAVAELARGLNQPTIKPVWLRDVIPEPPQPSIISAIAIPPLWYHDLHISLDYINQVKKDYFETAGGICSTFDVSVASIWQSRARAIKFEPDVSLTIYFGADARRFFADVLPASGGYYGNCGYLMNTQSSSQFLINASIFEVVKLVRDAKAKIPIDVGKWRRGELEKNPFVPELSYKTLMVTDWGNIGLQEIDYGWGTPQRIATEVPAALALPLCIFGLPSPRQNSLLAMARLVEEKHVSALHHELKTMTTYIHVDRLTM